MEPKIPIIELTEYERLWLTEAYNAFKENKRGNQRKIWSKLYGQVPENFNPVAIDSNLINSTGEDITILGIIALEKNLDVLKKLDKVIYCIKELLIANPEMTDVSIGDVSSKIGLDSMEVGSLLHLVYRYGRFYRSSSTEQDSIAIKTISIGGSGECYPLYLYFNGMENWINNQLVQEEINRKKDRDFFESNEKDFEKEAYARKSLVFKSRVASVNKGLVFVLMPFNVEWSMRIYTNIIQRNVQELGLQCIRADNLNGPIIIEDIWTQINQAGLIIADVTGKNSNVMYELGIAHALGKPVVLITQTIADRPFDTTHLRHYKYADVIGADEPFGIELKEAITSIYRDNYPNYSFLT
ncbi:MAG: hypothetical protein ABL876_05730 [Chitinophagaceae bacterium]